VPDPCIVLIAAADLLPSLKERTGDADGEVLTFTDADALRALEVITKRRPAVVALERVFAATPRGAALINRIKSDPSLGSSEIRIVAHDQEYVRVHARRTPEPAAPSKAATAVAAVPAPATIQPLDFKGTRRAPRYRIAAEVEVLIDGNQALLIDLSSIGAQVMSPNVLRPTQRVRMSLFDEKGTVRFNATIAWANFEIPAKYGPRYRAGIEFLDAKAEAVDTYCARHKA
jgi:hypothetical protein